MYCNYCGKVIQDDAAVCAYCGIRVGASVARKRLVRPRVGRKIAGVCLGCAEYFDLDVTLVRLMWLLVALMTGVGLIAYPIAWIVMPEEAGGRAARGESVAREKRNSVSSEIPHSPEMLQRGMLSIPLLQLQLKE